MQEFHIHIRSFPDVREFVSMATVQPFQVLVGSDKQMFNAKSFIGMMNLDFSRPIKVLCDCDQAYLHAFQQQLGKFLA